jgi:hypothetical protein
MTVIIITKQPPCQDAYGFYNKKKPRCPSRTGGLAEIFGEFRE